MDITIRDARPADAQVIVQIVREMAEEDNERTPVTEAYVAQYLASPGSGILLAEAGRNIAGLLTYSFRPGLFHAAPSCLIEQLAVRKEARSRGAGGALIKELLARTAALQCAEVSVSVMPDNAGAIRFYRRHGLTEEAVFLEKHFAS
jgi:ribosomal protein S18 acetylase RimI-like enzyme